VAVFACNQGGEDRFAEEVNNFPGITIGRECCVRRILVVQVG
jgi:hypothetical protein